MSARRSAPGWQATTPYPWDEAVGPTVLELAGLCPPAKMEAQSLLPFLSGTAAPPERRYIYSEHVPDRMLQRVDHLLMIRDRRSKLVEYVGMGAGKLFDLHEDHDELHDLWNSPAQRAIRDEMSAQLQHWFVTSTTAAAGWWKAPRRVTWWATASSTTSPERARSRDRRAAAPLVLLRRE